VQQLLVEGLLLSVLGGALGLLLSFWTNAAMISALSEALQGITNASLTFQPALDLSVVALTFAACVVATLLFGLAPALRASRRDVVADIKSNGASPTGTGKWNRFFAVRNVLVMAQVALSLVLLFSASLFLRGALAASDIPLGFEASDGLVTEMDFSLRNATPTDAQRSLATLVERMNVLPGVRRAAVSTQTPMSNSETNRRVLPASAPVDIAGATTGPLAGTVALYSGITPGYFETLSVPLLRGRDFTEIESRDGLAPRVAIIDTSLAQDLFPAGDALGQRIRTAGENGVEMEIVGIVGEHRHEFLQVDPTYRLFVPLVHGYAGRTFLQTRLRDASGSAVSASVTTVRQEMRRIDPDLPVLKHEPLNVFISHDASLWSARLGAVVFGLFGVVALLLSVMGVYSVKAYAVAARTREIGIRCALGARRSDIIGLVMIQGAKQIAVACAVGLVLALLVGQALTSLLFHISPADPLALVGATVILVVPALVASYIPARRALRISPNEALRSE
jgi:putative ABC transport system permease protein